MSLGWGRGGELGKRRGWGAREEAWVESEEIVRQRKGRTGRGRVVLEVERRRNRMSKRDERRARLS